MGNDIITTLPIDFAYDEPNMREARRAFEKRFDGVTLTVVNAHGPGGGWPEVTLTGERSNVVAALREAYASGNDEHDAWLVRKVVPA